MFPDLLQSMHCEKPPAKVWTPLRLAELCRSAALLCCICMRWQDARWRAGRLLLLHRLQEALCEANGFNLECHGVNVDVTAASSHSQHAEHLHVQVAISKSG